MRQPLTANAGGASSACQLLGDRDLDGRRRLAANVIASVGDERRCCRSAPWLSVRARGDLP
jgi:hypothetical protein